jgi:hypothetical protein
MNSLANQNLETQRNRGSREKRKKWETAHGFEPDSALQEESMLLYRRAVEQLSTETQRSKRNYMSSAKLHWAAKK